LLATRVATAVAGIPILFGLIWIGGWPYAIVAALLLAVAAWESTTLGFDPARTVGVIAYVVVFGAAIVALRYRDNGRDWVYLALFGTFAVDTTAYFVGRAIGRHRMAPAISPKKTWEGFAGGYAGGVAAVLLLNYFLGLRIGAGPALLIALTLPIAATLGDLFESWVKRRAGVKDASELIPGHGGVLDRLDSVLFTFPLVYVVARWFV
jgi:phosphatidate cytidylyltransferase